MYRPDASASGSTAKRRGPVAGPRWPTRRGRPERPVRPGRPGAPFAAERLRLLGRRPRRSGSTEVTSAWIRVTRAVAAVARSRTSRRYAEQGRGTSRPGPPADLAPGPRPRSRRAGGQGGELAAATSMRCRVSLSGRRHLGRDIASDQGRTGKCSRMALELRHQQGCGGGPLPRRRGRRLRPAGVEGRNSSGRAAASWVICSLSQHALRTEWFHHRHYGIWRNARMTTPDFIAHGDPEGRIDGVARRPRRPPQLSPSRLRS